MKLISVKKTTLDSNKKYVATFSDGSKIQFGAKGYTDYTLSKDKKRKELYLARHESRENWNNPFTAGSLSRWILWNKPTLQASIRDYKMRFGL